MTASDKLSKNPEMLQQIFETAKIKRTAAKKKRIKAEHKFKKAEQKSIGNFELQTLHLKQLKTKYKHKSLVAAYKLAELRWKHALKHTGTLTEESIETSSSEGKSLAKNQNHNESAALVHDEKLKKEEEKEKKHADNNQRHKEKKRGHLQPTDTKIHVEHNLAETKKDNHKLKHPVVKKTIVDTASDNRISSPKQEKSDSLKSTPVAQTKKKSAPPASTDNVQKITSAPHNVTNTTSSVDYSTNDLTLIEGIGKKVAQLLNENNIITFKDLSVADTENLKSILRKNRLQMMDPATWAEQAKLVVAGKIDALKKLQIEMKGAKKM